MEREVDKEEIILYPVVASNHNGKWIGALPMISYSLGSNESE